MLLNRLDTERVSTIIREALTWDLDAVWAVPPLIGEEKHWTVLEPSSAAVLIEDLAGSLVEGDQWINSGPITRVRTMKPLFYPGTSLCEAETRTFDGARGLIVFVKTPKGCALLDGTSRPIHKLNEMGLINLVDSDNVLQYIEFFCTATEAEFGPFRILSSRIELRQTRDLNPAEQYWYSSLDVSPPTRPQLSGDQASWTLSADVFYGGRLFHPGFKVQMSGFVSMESDAVKARVPFPVRVWGFWGKVRQDRTAACNPEAS